MPLRRLGLCVLIAICCGPRHDVLADPVALTATRPLFVALIVPDLDIAVAWYRDTFDLRVAKSVNDPDGRF